MGCTPSVGSKEEALLNTNADSLLNVAKVQYNSLIKVLLLGTGNSGKSTIFKQMQIIYDHGFTSNQRLRFRTIIRQNTINQFVRMCRMIEENKGDEDSGRFNSDESKIVQELYAIADRESQAGEDYAGNSLNQCADMIDRLWNVEQKNCLHELHMKHKEYFENFVYFFKHIKHVCESKYEPTDEDILRCRMPTTGIIERVFDMPAEHGKFLLVDVGGQRSERRKWIQAFDDVNTILFVCAINEFDTVLDEDPDTNALIESLEVFKGVVETKGFDGNRPQSRNDKHSEAKYRSFIIFLNKYDLFLEKLSAGKAKYSESPLAVSLSNTSDEFKGSDNNEQHISDHIKKQFMKLIPDDCKQQCHVHTTTATDTQLMQKIWKDTYSSIITGSLLDAGFQV